MADRVLPPPADVAERGRIDDRMFHEEIAGADAPVVLRGQFADWPAVVAGRAGAEAIGGYVAQMSSGRPLEVMIGAPEIEGRFFFDDKLQKLNFGRHQVPIEALMAELVRLAGVDNPHAVYASAAAIVPLLPGWTERNPLGLSFARAVPRIWIGNAARVATHYDLGANIAVVVAGHRRFTLFPPIQLPNLYVGPLERTIAGPPVSMVDPEAPDLERFPRFAEAARHAQQAELGPGDAIFIPSLWWHHVRAHDPVNVLVNYWPAPDPAVSPLSAMMHAMMSVRDLPARERAVWRDWFDHYVFADDAASASEHLPEAVRGFAGPGSAERTEAMRRFLIGSLQRPR